MHLFDDLHTLTAGEKGDLFEISVIKQLEIPCYATIYNTEGTNKNPYNWYMKCYSLNINT